MSRKSGQRRDSQRSQALGREKARPKTETARLSTDAATAKGWLGLTSFFGVDHFPLSLPNGNSSWRGSGLERRFDGFPDVRRRIGEALALRAFDGSISALDIIDPEFCPVIVAEIELGEITVEVLLNRCAGRRRPARA
jgi:hypothetical protein